MRKIEEPNSIRNQSRTVIDEFYESEIRPAILNESTEIFRRWITDAEGILRTRISAEGLAALESTVLQYYYYVFVFLQYYNNVDIIYQAGFFSLNMTIGTHLYSNGHIVFSILIL